ncbi:hypothetical protein ACQKP0_14965 [Heyndrickxia sp. NPDC080065]|uniref:hypothetical protein n=1 Tax=Heyndrickxia sp. NPDC080065 TaxID=3390568 RepID=UPI003CFD054A
MSKNELSILDKFIKNNVKETIIENYENRAIIRTLIQLIPYGGVMDTYLTTTFNNILIERSRNFFDELNSGNFILTEEIIDSEDFLHSYFSTYKAAIYTRQKSKIRFFARLLINGVILNDLSIINEYEDYLKILEDLTYREIYILYTLYKFENKYCSDILGADRAYIKQMNSNKYWNDFITKITKDLNIEVDEIFGLIHRLSRTGCYREFSGFSFSQNDGSGYTTHVFDKLVKLIAMEREDLSDINNIKII